MKKLQLIQATDTMESHRATIPEALRIWSKIPLFHQRRGLTSSRFTVGWSIRQGMLEQSLWAGDKMPITAIRRDLLLQSSTSTHQPPPDQNQLRLSTGLCFPMPSKAENVIQEKVKFLSVMGMGITKKVAIQSICKVPFSGIS